jgi:tetratricopeptide (TPR) repeat protein
VAREHKHEDGIEALEELDSLAERAARWVSEHAGLSAGALGALLLGTAAFAGWDSWASGREQAASDALESTRADYLEAMGAKPGDLDVPELANPKAAQQIRSDYAQRFRELAAAHRGSASEPLAWLEAAVLAQDDGDAKAALEALESGLAAARPGSPLRGLLLEKLGQLQEREGRWQEAAEAHLKASEIEAYPLRLFALADAARCFDAAGDPARARELLEQALAEAPELPVQEHLRSRLRELQALPASGSAAG